MLISYEQFNCFMLLISHYQIYVILNINDGICSLKSVCMCACVFACNYVCH